METSNAVKHDLTQPSVVVVKNSENPQWLQNFLDFYTVVTKESLEQLPTVYAEDIEFEDPMHYIKGIRDLTDYFAKLYTNVETSNFEILDVIQADNTASVFWLMSFDHPKLNGGKTIVVEGCTKLKGENDRIVYHRDYIDLGQMLYENVPVLGAIVRKLKSRVKV
jgi:limonene-1,2-epoxide hydrolase